MDNQQSAHHAPLRMQTDSSSRRTVELRLHARQYDFVFSDARFSFYVGGRGAGKALALDTPIPTPDGWTTMGEVTVGDVVFDERGQPCQVTFVTDVMQNRPCFQVSFSDGTVIVADGEHQWLTKSSVVRKAERRRLPGSTGFGGRPQCLPRHFPQVVTTEEVARTLTRHRRDGKRELNHAIDVAGALQLPEQALPIDPYVLGVWLGDGTSVYANVTTADSEILDEMRGAGYSVDLIPSSQKIHAAAYRIGKAPERRDPVTGRMVSNGSLHSTLRAIGVLSNKHIPMAYLRASVLQRTALLQGLMDTDGYVNVAGSCEFYSTNVRLADDVYELCGSLGIKAHRRSKPAMLNGVCHGTVYILAFTAYVPVFRLPRKLDRMHVAGGQADRQSRRYIVAVEPCPSVPVKCIQVNAPSHLYLASRAFIPTHNSYAGALRAILQTQEQAGSLGLVGAPTHPMLRDAAQRMFFDLCPPSLIRRHNKTDNHTIMRNGSEILWRSLDRDERTRGLNLGWFWLDEAPFCGYHAWNVLKATLRQPGYATCAWATGTPHGKDGYARDFELAPRDGHALYRASTHDNAANLPVGFVDDLGYTGAFAAQEIEGQFVAFDGLVYAFDATVGGNIGEHDSGKAFSKVIGGIDWGYSNPAVALVFGLDSDKRAWQLDEFYQRRASLEDTIIPAIVGLTRRHRVQVWYADSEDPEAIDRLNAALGREGLQTRARAVVKGAGSVRAGIQTVTTALAPRGDGTRGLYVSPRCIHTIAEFGAYAYAASLDGSDTPAKRDASEEPVKLNDHCMDALRYALHSELAGIAKTEAYLAHMVALQKTSEKQEGLVL